MRLRGDAAFRTAFLRPPLFLREVDFRADDRFAAFLRVVFFLVAAFRLVLLRAELFFAVDFLRVAFFLTAILRVVILSANPAV